MPFRTFSATVILEHGKVITTDISDPEKLYPKTFVHYLSQLVEQLVTEDCQSGMLRINSKKDKLHITTTGDLANCRQAIIDKISDVFEVYTDEDK